MTAMSELPGWGRGGRGDEKAPPQPIVKKKEYQPKREDGWTLVGRAGKQKAPAAEHEGASCAESSSRPASSDAVAGRLSTSHVVRQKIVGSGFARALATVRDDEALLSSIVAAIAKRWPQQPLSSVIVLGIGSPTTSASSRHQLALAGLLSEKLGLRECSVFDPVLDSDDLELLRQNSCRVLTEEESKLAHCCNIGSRTLFIMPHCELELYDAVLAANWDAARLSALAILGNSFNDYADNNPKRTRLLGKHLWCLREHIQEHRVMASNAHPVSAFNNMALHFFDAPRTALSAVET